MKNEKSYNRLLQTVEATQQAEPPSGLYQRIHQKINQSTPEIRISPWQYAAAAVLLLMNLSWVFYAQTTTPSEQSETELSTLIVDEYNLETPEYYNY
ncbi:hypothetical protein SAMN04488028_10483 [Reichenbachiella agariperforans]|uniref:Uncharacterized protein n=1 Tax=Reichenbachiella agariperforans TaxID=156994 RepID=A0A1M6R916_REIAG|nr:hypothetical protein [Reichenbachiella agariperforans]SHK28973.1 hypothetical protein SAMN04488028_10483 [Reichenbachiella agariperforans]